jgi:hypothetical protein
MPPPHRPQPPLTPTPVLALPHRVEGTLLAGVRVPSCPHVKGVGTIDPHLATTPMGGSQPFVIWIFTCSSFGCSSWGIEISKIPSTYVALIFEASAPAGSDTLRWKDP